MNSISVLKSADIPGDEASLPGFNENPLPGLVVNPDANGCELLSASMYRLRNALALMWLLLDRANGVGDDHLEGSIVVLLRLCTEANVLSEASMAKLGDLKVTEKTSQPGKAGKVPK